MRTTRRKARFAFLAAVTAFGLVAASCGSDDDKAADTTAAVTTTAATATTADTGTTTAATTGDTTAETTASSTDETTDDSTADTTDGSTADTTGGSTADTTGGSTDETTGGSEAPADYTLDAPIVIDALISDPGGSDQNAVADFNNGIRLAVDEINAAGGIGGQQIEFTAIETPPTGDAVLNSLNLALEDEPTAILGPVSSTALLAISQKVDEAGIPMIHSTTEPKAVHDGEAGSQWIFGNRPSNDGSATVAAKYALEELGAKNIGLMYVNTSFGTTGADAMKAAIDAGGGEVSADQSFEFNATDLTNVALAMDGSDAIIDWGTPGTLGLSVNTLDQQGLSDIPHIGPGSVGFGFFSAIVGDPDLLEGLYGVVDCNPTSDDRPEAKDFVQSYTDKYGEPPSYAATQQYDSVYILKHVIDEAQSADADSIREGLENLDGYSGICSENYRNDNGVLSHEVVVAKFEGGALVTQKSYELD